MKTEGFSFYTNNDKANSKLITSIANLPENTFEGLPVNEKTSIELIMEKSEEKIAITPLPYSGERLIVHYPEGSINPRASRECACFTYKDFNYKIIF